MATNGNLYLYICDVLGMLSGMAWHGMAMGMGMRMGMDRGLVIV